MVQPACVQSAKHTGMMCLKLAGVCDGFAKMKPGDETPGSEAAKKRTVGSRRRFFYVSREGEGLLKERSLAGEKDL